jgi:sugar phosphate isomerase/epimerase
MKKSPSAKSAPVLKQFAGFWTLTNQPSAAKQWTDEEKFKEAKQAGFEAMGGGANPAVVPLCEKYGMDYICYINAAADSYKANLEAAAKTNPARINVQMCDEDTLPKDAIKVWLKLEELAIKMKLQVDLEVHRDTCTETPEKTYEIADLYKKATGKKIRLCWDFSHLAVVKHLNPPYAPRLLLRPDLIQLSRQFHNRPFNGHHAQVPATDGKGNETPEIKAYLEFLDALIECWFQGAKGGEVVYACPEFGPKESGYGLSSFANVWKDAIFLREKTTAIWKAKQKAFLAGKK